MRVYKFTRGANMSKKKKRTRKKIKKSQEPKKRLKTGAIAAIVISAVVFVAICITAGVLIYKHVTKENIQLPDSPALESDPPYADGRDVFEEKHYQISSKTDDDKAEALQTIRNRDEAMTSYQIIIREEGSDGSLEINYWTENGKGVYEYIFKGYDEGVGLDGIYYRTMVDDVSTIIDYQTKEYHTKGDFYNKYFSKLSALNLDNILTEVFSESYTDIGKSSGGAQVLKSKDKAICVYDKVNYETYIIDKSGEKAMGYYIAYGKSYSMPHISLD